MIPVIYSNDNRNLPIHLNKSPESLDREMIFRALIDIKNDLIELKDMALNFNKDSRNDANTVSVNEVVPINKLEKSAIVNALNYTKGSKRKAAKLLDISERTLYRKLKEYEIQ